MQFLRPARLLIAALLLAMLGLALWLQRTLDQLGKAGSQLRRGTGLPEAGLEWKTRRPPGA